jgi:hypothetical protein
MLSQRDNARRLRRATISVLHPGTSAAFRELSGAPGGRSATTFPGTTATAGRLPDDGEVHPPR